MRPNGTKRGAAIAALTILALSAVVLASCGDDQDEEGQASAVLAAVSALDNAGLHGIDTSISQDGKVPATAHTTAAHMQTVMLATEWPKDLEEPAKSLAALLGDLAAAIDTDQPDMKKAAEAAKKAHTTGHDFSAKAWEYLGKKAGLEAGDHAHEEASPAPTATPSPRIQVVDATARATTSDVTAVYFTVKNPGAADRLVKASVDASVAKMAQLHTVVTEGATTTMKEVLAIDVPANGELVLKPGGYHVMLMNVQKPLKDGESVQLTLTFEKAGAVQVTAAVKTMAGGSIMSRS